MSKIERGLTVRVAEFKPHPMNYNAHPQNQVEALRESLRIFEQVRDVVVWREFIIAGHGVVEAAKAEGWTDISATRLPDDWDEERVLAYLAVDNETARLSEPDDAQLTALLQGVSDEELRALAAGGEDRLRSLIEADAPMVDAGPQIDRAAELQEKWGMKLGDLWEVGEHRLVCGDCTDAVVVERVMGGEKADAIVADPPYGMNLDTDWSGIRGTGKSMGAAKKIKGKAYPRVIGDDKPFDATVLFDLWDVLEMFLFGADYYSETIRGRADGSWLVWDKRKESQADGFGSEFELIWSKARHKRRILRHEWFGFLRAGEYGDSRVHPTQKPVALIVDIIQQWCRQVVADPFLGSGTTMVACQQLGRKCRGIELSPPYCAVTLERLSQMGLEPRLME